MNKISISKVQNPTNDASTLALSYEDANKMLPILRSDHFRSITLGNISEVEPKNLKFLIQLGRLLKADVQMFQCRVLSGCREATTRN
jgi:hypothetical protein